MAVFNPGQQQDKVLDEKDIPSSSANIPTTATISSSTSVTNMFVSNKDTRFENLVFQISNGFASISPPPYRTDAEFAERACKLARQIAYEMDKYGTTG